MKGIVHPLMVCFTFLEKTKFADIKNMYNNKNKNCNSDATGQEHNNENLFESAKKQSLADLKTLGLNATDYANGSPALSHNPLQQQQQQQQAASASPMPDRETLGTLASDLNNLDGLEQKLTQLLLTVKQVKRVSDSRPHKLKKTLSRALSSSTTLSSTTESSTNLVPTSSSSRPMTLTHKNNVNVNANNISGTGAGIGMSALDAAVDSYSSASSDHGLDRENEESEDDDSEDPDPIANSLNILALDDTDPHRVTEVWKDWDKQLYKTIGLSGKGIYIYNIYIYIYIYNKTIQSKKQKQTKKNLKIILFLNLNLNLN